MSYQTNGKYQKWGEYLVGYRVVRPNGMSRVANIPTPLGEWMDAGPQFQHPRKDAEAMQAAQSGIWHAAELHEVKNYWRPYFRAVRILVLPYMLYEVGRATECFVQAMTEPMEEWPEGGITWPTFYVPDGGEMKLLEGPQRELLPALPEPEEGDTYVISSGDLVWGTLTPTAPTMTTQGSLNIGGDAHIHKSLVDRVLRR